MLSIETFIFCVKVTASLGSSRELHEQIHGIIGLCDIQMVNHHILVELVSSALSSNVELFLQHF